MGLYGVHGRYGGCRINRKFDNKLDSLDDRGTLASCIVIIVFHVLAGIGLLAVSVWLYVDTASYLAGDHNDKFFVSIYILMAAGSLMTLVGFLGCCGAMQESSCMLATFSTFVLVIFAAEIAGAVYGYSHQEEVKAAITKRVTNMIKNEYGVQSGVTIAVDTMQEKLKCCGANSAQDWSDSTFNKGLKERNIAEKLVGFFVYKVPLSCCTQDDTEECKKAVEIQSLASFGSNIFSEGCVGRLEQKIESHLYTIIAVGIGIAVIQIFGFVFSLVLCCAVSGKAY